MMIDVHGKQAAAATGYVQARQLKLALERSQTCCITTS
jgi:hypothetical protein